MEAGPKGRREHWEAEARTRPDSPTVHYNLGLTYTELGRMTSAERAYRRAVELDPELVEAWVNLGGTLLLQWRFEEALDATREAVRLAPEKVLAHFNLGQAALYLGKADEVVAANRRVLELEPNHAAAHYFLAVGLLALGDADGAKAEMSHAARLGHRPTPEFMRSLERAAAKATTTVPVMEIGSAQDAERG